MRVLQRRARSLRLLVQRPVHSDRSFGSLLVEVRAFGRTIPQDTRLTLNCVAPPAEPTHIGMGMARRQLPWALLKVAGAVAPKGLTPMKTYPVLAKDGSKSAAFEVENAYIGLMTVSRLLRQVGDVTDVRPRQLFSSSDGVHIEFKYRGTPFIVWEPYGDSSRYWIGPKEGAEASIECASLEQAFGGYRPPLYRSIIGDVLTLRFMKRSGNGNT